MTKSTKLRRVDSSVQSEMFSGLRPVDTNRRRLTKKFVDPDPELLTVGNLRLCDFLTKTHADLPIKIREVIREIDYTNFTKKYDLNGRAPYHPSIIIGLVIYGFLKNQGSLRQLEALATLDLGAHWITGGIMPDHATIGRFLQLHCDTITQEFFENLTRQLIHKIAKPSHDWAIDGTIIESVASRYQVLKLEAAKELLVELEREAFCAPSDVPPDDSSDEFPSSSKSLNRTSRAAKPNLDKLKKAIGVGVITDAKQRETGSKSKSAPCTTQVCLTDPEAIVLKTKRHTFAPAYAVSLVTGMDRMIYGYHVDQRSENQSLDLLFAQAIRVAGPPKHLLMDTGYYQTKIAELVKLLGGIMICPPKQSTLEEPENQKYFSASIHFKFFEEEGEKKDYYLCPAGKKLTFRFEHEDDRREGKRRVFRTKPSNCLNCPLQSQCTPSSRSITRNDLLEELREIYADLNNQELYKQRMHTVEPAIGALKTDHGLTKFTRIGMRGALLEVCLNACAHNIKRAIKLVEAWPFLAVLNDILMSLRLVQVALYRISMKSTQERPIMARLMVN